MRPTTTAVPPYRWVGKTLDIVASSMFYTCDIDKTWNNILKIPWYH